MGAEQLAYVRYTALFDLQVLYTTGECIIPLYILKGYTAL